MENLFIILRLVRQYKLGRKGRSSRPGPARARLLRATDQPESQPEGRPGGAWRRVRLAIGDEAAARSTPAAGAGESKTQRWPYEAAS